MQRDRFGILPAFRDIVSHDPSSETNCGFLITTPRAVPSSDPELPPGCLRERGFRRVTAHAVAFAGISAEELARYERPANYQDHAGAVPQPSLDGPGPHMTNHPPGAYALLLGAPDEKVLHSVTNQPPVKVA